MHRLSDSLPPDTYRVSVLAAAYLVKQQGVAIDVAIESVGNQRVAAETVKLVLAN